MKTPVWILQGLLAAGLASQGWLILAVIDMGKQQAAQGAQIEAIRATISGEQQITKTERSKNE